LPRSAAGCLFWHLSTIKPAANAVPHAWVAAVRHHPAPALDALLNRNRRARLRTRGWRRCRPRRPGGNDQRGRCDHHRHQTTREQNLLRHRHLPSGSRGIHAIAALLATSKPKKLEAAWNTAERSFRKHQLYCRSFYRVMLRSLAQRIHSSSLAGFQRRRPRSRRHDQRHVRSRSGGPPG
jgi:hypothetical protein